MSYMYQRGYVLKFVNLVMNAQQKLPSLKIIKKKLVIYFAWSLHCLFIVLTSNYHLSDSNLCREERGSKVQTIEMITRARTSKHSYNVVAQISLLIWNLANNCSYNFNQKWCIKAAIFYKNRVIVIDDEKHHFKCLLLKHVLLLLTYFYLFPTSINTLKSPRIIFYQCCKTIFPIVLV